MPVPGLSWPNKYVPFPQKKPQQRTKHDSGRETETRCKHFDKKSAHLLTLSNFQMELIMIQLEQVLSIYFVRNVIGEKSILNITQKGQREYLSEDT